MRIVIRNLKNMGYSIFTEGLDIITHSNIDIEKGCPGMNY